MVTRLANHFIKIIMYWVQISNPLIFNFSINLNKNNSFRCNNRDIWCKVNKLVFLGRDSLVEFNWVKIMALLILCKMMSPWLLRWIIQTKICIIKPKLCFSNLTIDNNIFQELLYPLPLKNIRKNKTINPN